MVDQATHLYFKGKILSKKTGMKIALVTMIIPVYNNWLGDMYHKLFQTSQEVYAKKHGYDHIIIREYMETNENAKYPSAVSFQKALVFSQPWSEKYDYIVYIDSDIIIHHDAPPIHKIFEELGGKIGIVDEFPQGSEFEPQKYYAENGYRLSTRILLNTGVIIAQPFLHGKFLREIFEKYVEKCAESTTGYHLEQSSIGYELQVRNLYKLLPGEYNALWCLAHRKTSLEEFYQKNYFIHFAAKIGWDLISTVIHKYFLKETILIISTDFSKTLQVMDKIQKDSEIYMVNMDEQLTTDQKQLFYTRCGNAQFYGRNKHVQGLTRPMKELLGLKLFFSRELDKENLCKISETGTRISFPREILDKMSSKILPEMESYMFSSGNDDIDSLLHIFLDKKYEK
jgi:hypothetical protein